jgi:hypothetical protein
MGINLARIIAQKYQMQKSIPELLHESFIQLTGIGIDAL